MIFVQSALSDRHIDFFSYFKFYENGCFCWLSSDKTVYNYFIEHRLIDELPIIIFNSFPNSGFYLVDRNNFNDKPIIKTQKIMEDFDYKHTANFIMTQKIPDKSTLSLFTFATKQDHPAVNNQLLHKYSTLKEFSHYIQARFQNFLHNTKKFKVTNQDLPRLVEQLSKYTPNHYPNHAISPQLPVKLTTREREVIHWCINGKSADETAQIIGIAKKTVERHFENLRYKLHCYNKQQIILKSFGYIPK